MSLRYRVSELETKLEKLQRKFEEQMDLFNLVCQFETYDIVTMPDQYMKKKQLMDWGYQCAGMRKIRGVSNEYTQEIWIKRNVEQKKD